MSDPQRDGGLGRWMAAALVRELREELAVEVQVHGAPIARTVADTFVSDVWAVHRWRGELVNAAPDEHDALAWLDVGDLAGLQLAHSDLPGQVRLALDGGRPGRTSEQVCR